MIEVFFLILALILLLGIMSAGRRGSRNARRYPCQKGLIPWIGRHPSRGF